MSKGTGALSEKPSQGTWRHGRGGVRESIRRKLAILLTYYGKRDAKFRRHAPHCLQATRPWVAGIDQFTVRSAVLLVTLPAALLTMTEKSEPLSALTVAGVV